MDSLQAYKNLYPLVKIQIEFMNSAEAHQAILQGQADIDVTTENSGLDVKLRSTIIWQDTLRFVVARDYPLVKIKKLRLAHIAQYPAILSDRKFYTAQLVTNLFNSHKLQLLQDQGLGANYLQSSKVLLAVGATWSVLPESMRDKKLIAALVPVGIKLSRKLLSISHRDRSLNQAALMFMQLLETMKAA